MLCTHYYIVTHHFSNKNAPYVYASLSVTEDQLKMTNLTSISGGKLRDQSETFTFLINIC
jgi:hypothetical protein